jgi:hypothetical protein
MSMLVVGTPCARCERPMVRNRQMAVPAGWARHHCHGLCIGCHTADRRSIKPRPRKPRTLKVGTCVGCGLPMAYSHEPVDGHVSHCAKDLCKLCYESQRYHGGAKQSRDPLDVDEIAVERACRGDKVPLNRTELDEAVRTLLHRRPPLNDHEIAVLLHRSAATVRYRRLEWGVPNAEHRAYRRTA